MPVRLFRHLTQDGPQVTAPLLARTALTDDTLLAELPRLDGPSRAVLRQRRTLSADLSRGLERYGPADRTLAPERTQPAAIVERDEQSLWPAAKVSKPNGAPDARPVAIRVMVDRIDRFRRNRSAPVRPVAPTTPPVTPPPSREAIASTARFAFETGRDGVIRWTDAAARGAVIGLSLAEAGPASGQPHDVGVDQSAADLFARRAPLRRVTLRLPIGTPLAGAWVVEATPVFAPGDGRFTGYVGHARRADAPAIGERWSLVRSDSLRQLMHELRTPLNAILGFSELIEQQLLGPLPAAYAAQAGAMRISGERVLAALDDVDLSARYDADAPSVFDESGADLTAVVTATRDRVHAGLGARVFTAPAADPRPVAAGPVVAGRLVDRLLGAAAAAARPGERLSLAITGRKWARLRVGLPDALATDDQQALDALRLTNSSVAGEGPLLGLEFTLRLVRRMAEEAGGSFVATAGQFTLSLPVAMQGSVETRR